MDDYVDDHILDILGIGSREDSYTDLIAYAFKHYPVSTTFSQIIRDSALCQFQGTCKRVRGYRAATGSNQKQKERARDLVLVDRETQTIVLIETKLFAGEGCDQTKDYASNWFQSSLGRHHDLITPHFAFYFLTLDGKKPESEDSRAMKWKDVADCVPENLGTTKLDMLLREFKDRVSQHSDWPFPAPEQIVLEYLKKVPEPQRLIGWHQTFRKFGENLLAELKGFEKEFHTANNPREGFIPLVLFYKSGWVSTEPNQNDGKKNFSIHFELQWSTGKPDADHLTLYVHYETNPYRTRGELKKESADFQAGYGETREAFVTELKKASALPDWTIRTSFLQIARYEFDRKRALKISRTKHLASSMT